MAPIIAARGTTSNSKLVWIFLVSIIASTLLIAVVAIVIVKRLKSRKYAQVNKVSPEASGNGIAAQQPMPPMGSVDGVDDFQRELLIRKSWTDRSSSRSASYSSQGAPIAAPTAHPVEVAAPPSGLRQDWKDWEANIQLEHSRSLQCHPAVTRVPEKNSCAASVSDCSDCSDCSDYYVVDSRPRSPAGAPPTQSSFPGGRRITPPSLARTHRPVSSISGGSR